MRPVFSISADGSDISGLIQDRLVELRITDQAGFDSDEISIRLDNRDHKVAKPKLGAELSVSIGYRETGLSSMGRWVVSAVSVSGPPDMLTITGRAADLLKGLKVRRTASWDKKTLGDIASTIAARHGLTPKISPDLAEVMIDHVDQTESDLHLLTKLAKHHGGVAKPAGGCLVLAPRGKAEAVASGRPLPAVTLAREDLASWEATDEGRAEHGKVRAAWQNLDTGKREMVSVGGGDGPTQIVQGSFPNEAEARKAATAKFKALQRGKGRLSIETVGNPSLMAEAPLTVTGIDGVDGTWTITSATHTLDGRGGYRCEVEGERG